ncbi:MAG: DUF4363 family protein [Clostridiales bacterium]|nr:DUF4363 family protein [Clostridiales bacterium]
MRLYTGKPRKLAEKAKAWQHQRYIFLIRSQRRKLFLPKKKRRTTAAMKKLLILLLLFGILSCAYVQNRCIADFRDDFTAEIEKTQKAIYNEENPDFSGILSVYEKAEPRLICLIGNDKIRQIGDEIQKLFILKEKEDILLSLKELQSLADALYFEDRFSLENIL